MLEERGIRVRNNRTKGYYLIGSEMEIRRMMMKYVIYTLAEEQSAEHSSMSLSTISIWIFLIIHGW